MLIGQHTREVQPLSTSCRWDNNKKAEMTLRQVHMRGEVVEVHNNPVMGSFNYPNLRGKVLKHMLT